MYVNIINNQYMLFVHNTPIVFCILAIITEITLIEYNNETYIKVKTQQNIIDNTFHYAF